MAGFFGLFGNKTRYIDEPDEDNNQSEEKNEPFFLTPDEAKSFGNIQFMRTPINIKKTFPKTKSSQSTNVLGQNTSTEKPKLPQGDNYEALAREIKKEPNSSRRTNDPNLDMFRNMAKQIKKP